VINTPTGGLNATPTNPANPHDYQTPYDQHVWFPQVGATYVDLDHVPETREGLEAYLQSAAPEVRLHELGRKHRLIVEERLADRLPSALMQQALELCAEHGLDGSIENAIRLGTHHLSDFRETLGTSHINPPDDIHRMQHADWYCGDFYSADMLLSSLAEAGLGVEPGREYLDFGCSSGSLIRAMIPYEPLAKWHGVDPIQSAVNWAKENIPSAEFAHSNVMPPLKIEPGTIDGATAVSIWSHLGEERALAWFREMARCVKPGGWLAFTTHGWTSLDYYNRTQMKLPDRLRALLEGLMNSNFVFEEVYLGESPEGLSADGYGNTYFTRDWVLGNLSDNWRIERLDPGQNQQNQDVYILRRK